MKPTENQTDLVSRVNELIDELERFKKNRTPEEEEEYSQLVIDIHHLIGNAEALGVDVSKLRARFFGLYDSSPTKAKS